MKRFALLIVCLAFLATGSGCCLWGPYGCGGGGCGYGGYGGGGGGCPGGCGYGTGYGPSYSPYGTPTTYLGGPTMAAYPYYPQVTAAVPVQAVPQ